MFDELHICYSVCFCSESRYKLWNFCFFLDSNFFNLAQEMNNKENFYPLLFVLTKNIYLTVI